MLSIIGEASISSLSSPTYETSLAISILDETVKEMCQNSWVFNTEVDVTMASNGTNVVVPAHYIQVIDSNEEYVIRDNSGTPILYSMKNKTSALPTAIVATKVVYLLTFLDLPEPAKRYCTIRAGRIYADRLVGSRDIRMFTDKDEMEAKAKLGRYEHGTDAINMLSGSKAVANVLNRNI